MAKLDASQRNSLPSSSFALPGKRAYPINDESHAVQALRMRSHASPEEQKEIVSKVKRKFPNAGDTNPVYE